MAESSLSKAEVFGARPTIRLAGAEDLRATTLMTAMRMEESEGGMSRLELRLSNWASLEDGKAEYAFGLGAKLKLGASIEVYSGDQAQPREIFKGSITAVEAEYSKGEPELTVLAEDILQAARMKRMTRLHEDKSPADLASAIAGEMNLTPKVAGLAAPKQVWAQLNESDLAFLRRILGRFDADIQLVGKELHVSPRDDVKRNAIELQLHSQLQRARITVDLADQVTKITARGWNPKDGRAVTGSASAVTHGGPGQGKDGKTLLKDAFGGGERYEHVGHIAVESDDEAKALAEAAFDLRARRFVVIDGVSRGNAELRVGSHCKILGVDSCFENTYYVTRAAHLFDNRDGYRTEFSAECAYLGGQ